MEVGFLLDCTEGGVVQQSWTIGVPKRRWIGGVKVKKDEIRSVVTDRCKACGLLKSYAKVIPSGAR